VSWVEDASSEWEADDVEEHRPKEVQALAIVNLL